ncbi:glycosyltransferase family 4 protein [Thioclava pacifica]|uniref:Glycosyl transferase family 1 domain-containing protein n=1 Tax=Thioclava pacifica DSM 10166 TaxID=1353537 RepID=A0A074JDW0_9RHOB|nr:glycosyltransferase family 4 protein [Thioclava pacifica]KEO54704.1 hypothetical protein TP2_17365 [Thioclava pacifica DSM 10166]
MKIAILHTRLSGYMAASLRALKRQTECEFLIYCWPNQPDAPFDMAQFEDLGTIRNRRDHTDDEIETAVRAFSPDVILTSGWADKGYLRICKRMRASGVPVVAGSDTQWKGSLRQMIAGWTARLHVRRAIDALWVSGERQAVLARSLGYAGDRIWDGYYACDWSKFSAPTAVASDSEARRYFLFVGRYVEDKGLDTLAAAYRRYRDMVEEPWDLVCAGAGPLGGMLRDAGGQDLGFVQPDALPAVMQGAAAFVLPSRFEPWGVVVQEAAASGLPLVLSDQVGAGVHLLRRHWNGFSFPAGSDKTLAWALLAMHEMPDAKRDGMARNSFMLSKQYTPERWGEMFVSGLKDLQTVRSRN